MKLLRRGFRYGMTALQSVRRLIWFVTRPSVEGVHAIALTAGGKVILVKHRYTRGWHLPGGGQKRKEAPAPAILRELREEIGLLQHDSVDFLERSTYRMSYRTVSVSLFVVRGIVHKPAWSLEIEQVKAFGRDELPSNLSPLTRERLMEHLGSFDRG